MFDVNSFGWFICALEPYSYRRVANMIDASLMAINGCKAPGVIIGVRQISRDDTRPLSFSMPAMEIG